MKQLAMASVSCQAPGCDYGPGGGPAVLRGSTMAQALKERGEHLRSAHPKYQPPKGSLQSRVPRLD